jgi:hypothetical protein
MIKTITDPSEVWFLLEKAGVHISDFLVDHLLAFELEDDFCIVNYSAADRSFICFFAENAGQDVSLFAAMMNAVQDQGNGSEKWRSDALKLIEHKLHSKNNQRFFFDAH